MRIAFKEWAAVCKALIAGRQTVILRKGGIVEDGGEFTPAHKSFLLMPTYLHQSADPLVPEARVLIDAPDSVEARSLRIEAYAEVDAAIRVESHAALEQIAAEHV